MLTRLVYTLLLALAWVMITGTATLEALLVGLLVGGVLALLAPDPTPLNLRRLPDQLLAFVLYLLMLLRDIIFSGVDVARRVLSPDMKLKPGIITVSTQDELRSPTVLALSANYVTLTPGELVVDVAEDHLMYVHCLNIYESAAVAEQAQAARLRLLKRILGRES
jgi:multisubunit Na+/H+ antiporter MnhE subunit